MIIVKHAHIKLIKKIIVKVRNPMREMFQSWKIKREGKEYKHVLSMSPRR